jgi:hypothetical protein
LRPWGACATAAPGALAAGWAAGALFCARVGKGAKRTLKTKRAAIGFMAISCSEVSQPENYSDPGIAVE